MASPRKKRAAKPRELSTLGMILTRKGGRHKDKRLKRTTKRTRDRDAIQEHL